MRNQSKKKQDNEKRLTSINQNISDLIHKPEYGSVYQNITIGSSAQPFEPQNNILLLYL
jgi:hypothetical protein